MKTLWTALVFLAAGLAILYGFDYLSAKFAIPGNRQVYADVTITRYYAVKEKGNKIEYMPADPQVERCVYSVFPHFGYSPCWYVMRHTRRAIEVGRGDHKSPLQAQGRALSQTLARGEDRGVVDVLGG